MKLSIENIIMDSIKESLGHLLDEPSENESSLQDKMTHSLKPFKSKKNKNNASTIADEEENPEKKGNEKSKQTPDLKSASAEKVLKYINLIRSGKSSKDKETKERFLSYFKSLTDDEQLALQAFVDGLSDIFLDEDEEDPTDADRPFQEPYNLKIKKDLKTITPSKDEEIETQKGEDAPIVVGEAANKSLELKIVGKNNR